jgi:exodeoxyribonuclease VII small subunit
MAKRSAKDEADGAPQEKLSFEQAVAEMESIIEQIERGEIGLEESLKQRKRGDQLIKRCRAILDAAEQELEEIRPDDESE